MPLGVADVDRILVREARRTTVYVALLVPPGCRELGLSAQMFSGHAGLVRRALIRELARVSTSARRQVQPNAPFRIFLTPGPRWARSQLSPRSSRRHPWVRREPNPDTFADD